MAEAKYSAMAFTTLEQEVRKRVTGFGIGQIQRVSELPSQMLLDQAGLAKRRSRAAADLPGEGCHSRVELRQLKIFAAELLRE